jgi:hypothetical protein
MDLRVTTITLRLEHFGGTPERWDWHDLLDLAPEESVTVVIPAKDESDMTPRERAAALLTDRDIAGILAGSEEA